MAVFGLSAVSQFGGRICGRWAMKVISAEGFEAVSLSAGSLPTLQWLPIADLVVDPTYHRAITGKGRRNVSRIARTFSWTCFSPVIVAQAADGKFVIIDGQHRATAAAVVGFETVPCQIVAAATCEEQAAAFRAINGTTNSVSRMALHGAALEASEDWAIQLAEICALAEVQLLRYPVPVDRQTAGKTMAIGAVAQCLKRYGEETLVTALQCVTQTTNNQPGALSARMIKALCAVLHSDQTLRDSGLTLLEAFDTIDLAALHDAAVAEAAIEKVSPVQALSEKISSQLWRRLPNRIGKLACETKNARSGNRIAVEFPNRKLPGRRGRPLQPS
jgi:hypothetical protein